MKGVSANNVAFIRLLHNALQQPECKAEQVFQDWLKDFELVHGAIERKRTVNRAKLVRHYSIEASALNLQHLLFAIETAYALRLGLLAYSALDASRTTPLLVREREANCADLEFLERLYSPTFFTNLGIRNYSELDRFSWFLNEPDVRESAELKMEVADAQSEGPALVKSFDGDPLRIIYHSLVPKQIRHALGAHYTPEWLAEHTLVELGYGVVGSRPWESRLVDPTCGSGTFNFAALRLCFDIGMTSGVDPDELLQAVLRNVVGFDINPLAVLSAKTNFIFALSKFIAHGAEIPAKGVHLPIYLADSIYHPLTPTASEKDLFSRPAATCFRFAGQAFSCPSVVLTRVLWHKLVDSIARSVPEGLASEAWLSEAKQILGHAEHADVSSLSALYHLIEKRADRGLLRSSLQELRDALEPQFQSGFDFVAGNPPWVNWEYLPPAYRELIKDMWPKLGLFDLTGRDRAFSKEDISVLVAYVACNCYLRSGGSLGFVMPQSIFKSSLNSRGFRKFRLGRSGAYLRVLKVDDFVKVNPFDGVSNRASVLFLEKDSPTTYPVPYRVWHLRTTRNKFSESDRWTTVLPNLRCVMQQAMPSNPELSESHWVTGESHLLDVIPKLTGECAYRARTGVFTGGLNGVFYLHLIETTSQGLLRVRNIIERTKIIVPEIEFTIEPTFVYPLLRGRDVDRWQATPSSLILCPHTAESRMSPVSLETLRSQAPLTYKYFEKFHDALEARKGFLGWERQYLEQAFYAIQRVGDYTFARYKVVWRYICQTFTCAVVGPSIVGETESKPVLPHEKLMLMPFEDATEAFYVCGMLSSSPVRSFVESRMVETQIAPHVIQNLNLPRYDPESPLHKDVSRLCALGHDDPLKLRLHGKTGVMSELDRCAAKILGLHKSELVQVQSVVAGAA